MNSANNFLNGMSKFFMISVLGGFLIGSLVMGTVAALIGAAIPKKILPAPLRNNRKFARWIYLLLFLYLMKKNRYLNW